MLVIHDFWECVTREKPAPTADANMIRTWEKNDQKAKGKIILAIKPSKLKHITRCETSKEVWEKLKELH